MKLGNYNVAVDCNGDLVEWEDVDCGCWTDAWADNWVSVYYEDRTDRYMMEYRCYDLGLNGRRTFDEAFFNSLIKRCEMKKQW